MHYGKLRQFKRQVASDDPEFLKDVLEEVLMVELEREHVDKRKVLASWPRLEADRVVGFVAQVAISPERPYYRLLICERRLLAEGIELELEFRGPVPEREGAAAHCAAFAFYFLLVLQLIISNY